jgi:hypothetical protein
MRPPGVVVDALESRRLADDGSALAHWMSQWVGRRARRHVEPVRRRREREVRSEPGAGKIAPLERRSSGSIRPSPRATNDDTTAGHATIWR